jgi:hypothetical protein
MSGMSKTRVQPCFINVDVNLINQLPNPILHQTLQMLELTCLTGFRAASRQYHGIIPDAPEIYKYIIGWISDQQEKNENLEWGHSVKHGEIILSDDFLQDILQANDLRALESLLLKHNVIEADWVSDCYIEDHIQSPEMYNLVMDHKTPREIELFIKNDYEMYFDTIIERNGLGFERAERLWNIKKQAALNSENMDKKLFETGLVDEERHIFLLVAVGLTEEQIQQSSLFAQVKVPGSVLDMINYRDVMIRPFITGCRFPIHDLIDRVTDSNTDQVIATLTRCFDSNNFHQTFWLRQLNASKHNQGTILEAIYRKRPLNRTLLSFFNKLPLKRDNRIFWAALS